MSTLGQASDTVSCNRKSDPKRLSRTIVDLPARALGFAPGRLDGEQHAQQAIGARGGAPIERDLELWLEIDARRGQGRQQTMQARQAHFDKCQTDILNLVF